LKNQLLRRRLTNLLNRLKNPNRRSKKKLLNLNPLKKLLQLSKLMRKPKRLRSNQLLRKKSLPKLKNNPLRANVKKNPKMANSLKV
jgi:hypothetical protein